MSRSEGATPGSSPTVDLNHRFTGQELDPETGLHYYGGRYYDQEIGRFASPDPYVQEPDNPQNVNRYTYVLNNPQNFVDPSGHFWELFVAAFAAAATIAAEVAAPTLLSTALVDLVGTIVMFSFPSSFYLTQQYGSHTELDKLSQQRAADKGANSNKVKPQGDNALSRDYPSGDNIPGQGQEPWWNFNFCGFIFACNAHAGDDGEGGWRLPPGMPPPLGRPRVPGDKAAEFLKKLPRPLPRGVSQSEFGDKIMKWGTGDSAARGRIPELTKEYLTRNGVTEEIAKAWRDFYWNAKMVDPGNPSALGRFELMSRALQLLGGP